LEVAEQHECQGISNGGFQFERDRAGSFFSFKKQIVIAGKKKNEGCGDRSCIGEKKREKIS
jgi:hypothetical protein